MSPFLLILTLYLCDALVFKTFVQQKPVNLEFGGEKLILSSERCWVKVQGVPKRKAAMVEVEVNAIDHAVNDIPFLDLALKAFEKAYGGKEPLRFNLKVDSQQKHELYVTDRRTVKTPNDCHVVQHEPFPGEIVDWCSACGKSLAAVPRGYMHKFNLLHRGIGAIIFDSHGRIHVHKRAASKQIFPSMMDMLIGGVSTAGEPASVTLLRELDEELNLDFSTASSEMRESLTDKQKRQKKKRDPYLLENHSTAAREAYVSTKEDILSSLLGQRVEDSVETQDGSSIRYLGETTVQTSYNHCIVDVYIVVCCPTKAETIAFKDEECEYGSFVEPRELYAMLESEGRNNFVPDGLQVWDALPTMCRGL